MTAYGYVFEVFDALYSGERARAADAAATASSANTAWSYWGAVVFNFVVLQPLWWRARAAHAVDAVRDLDQRRGRHVARALHDPGDQPLSRLPGVVVGRLSRRRSGTGRSIAGTIGLFLVPFLLIIRLLPVISIFETKEVLHEEKEELRHGR